MKYGTARVYPGRPGELAIPAPRDENVDADGPFLGAWLSDLVRSRIPDAHERERFVQGRLERAAYARKISRK